tara:strand:+ start:3060 stop:3242 length:183 start_codon:yes stop_codon:yes gene_type:complete
MENNIDGERDFLEDKWWEIFENDVDEVYQELKSKFSGTYLDAAIQGLNTRLKNEKEKVQR